MFDFFRPLFIKYLFMLIVSQLWCNAHYISLLLLRWYPHTTPRTVLYTQLLRIHDHDMYNNKVKTIFEFRY